MDHFEVQRRCWKISQKKIIEIILCMSHDSGKINHLQIHIFISCRIVHSPARGLSK